MSVIKFKLFISFQFMSIYSLFMPVESMQMVTDHLNESEKRRKKIALARIFKQRKNNENN